MNAVPRPFQVASHYQAAITDVRVEPLPHGRWRWQVDVVLPDGVPITLSTEGVAYVPIVHGVWPLPSLVIQCLSADGQVAYCAAEPAPAGPQDVSGAVGDGGALAA